VRREGWGASGGLGELSTAPRDDCTGGDDRILNRRRGVGMFIRVTDRFGSTSESVIDRHRVSFTG